MRAHSIGVSVSETKPEMMIATAIVTANSRKMRPTMPPISRTGMNTATSENVIEMMVKPISLAPLSAASNGRMPFSMWRTMFSSITMASSTTNPTDNVSASSVMLLIENPSAYIAAAVPISDTGTASVGMMVADAERRNRKITSTTSATAITSVICTSSTDSRTEIERSLRTSRLTDAGSAARIERQPLAHRVDHRHRVGAGLALHAEHDGAVLVEPGRLPVVLDAVDDVGDFMEPHRRAVAPGDDDLLVFVGRPHRRRRATASRSGAGRTACRPANWNWSRR